jgi:hypothetical protein
METLMSRYHAALILTVALAAPISAQRIERSHVAVRGLIGESVGMASGIHLASGSRNSFAGDLGVALGIAALSTVAAPVTYGISLLAVPVTQLIVGTHREMKARRK